VIEAVSLPEGFCFRTRNHRASVTSSKVIRIDRNSRSGRTLRGRERINAEGVRITLLEGMRLYLIYLWIQCRFAFLPPLLREVIKTHLLQTYREALFPTWALADPGAATRLNDNNVPPAEVGSESPLASTPSALTALDRKTGRCCSRALVD
jgi:hypothetical protein